MDRFSKFHPLAGFSFFMFEIIITLLYINPVFAVCSLICAFIYCLILKGGEAAGILFKAVLPLVLFAGVFNMLFCRYGSMVLFSVKEISFTAEPLIYGLCTGAMLGAVIFWFLSYSAVIDSEKFTALFGKIAPGLSLLFLMVLRFVPLMRQLAKEIFEAQKGLGNETGGIKNTVKRFSALVSVSLEKSIETADAMRSLGYAGGKRRHYSRFRLKAGDIIALVFFAASFAALIVLKVLGAFEFVYSDGIGIESFSLPALIIFIVFSLFPTAVDLKEEIKWIFLRSKI